MQCSSTIGANVLAAAPQARLQRRQRAAGLAGASLRPCSAPGARPTRLGNSQHADNRPGRCAAAQQEEVQGGAPPPPERQPEQPALVGEDAAVFDLSQQSLRSWVIFGALLTGVLAMLYPVSIEQSPMPAALPLGGTAEGPGVCCCGCRRAALCRFAAQLARWVRWQATLGTLLCFCTAGTMFAGCADGSPAAAVPSGSSLANCHARCSMHTHTCN